MDGHECSEVLLSKLERTNRLDAEFYKKNALEISKILEALSAKPITEYIKISDGNHMSISEHFVDTGIPYYRGQDIYNLFIENSKPVYIERMIYDKPLMQRSHLKKGDILMSIVGAIVGNSAMVTSDKDATCSCKLAIMRCTNNLILPETLLIYIKTKYGQNQIQKFRRGAAQTGLILEDFDQIYIPLFSMCFQEKLVKVVNRIKQLTECSVAKYGQVEEYLINILDIDLSCDVNGGASIKSFSESFENTGRLDAEYYQPKYDKLINAIMSSRHKKLKEIVSIYKSIEPGSDAYQEEGIPFIRISDISQYGISKTDKYLERRGKYDLPEYYLKKNEILFSKDGSVGIAYKVENDTQAITSSALLHLSVNESEEILPDYLTAVLNSKIVQLQAERDAGGSIIKHWKPSEIEEVLIPILDIEIQKNISQKVIESFELQNCAKLLLEVAKQAVEIAIEQNETIATEWLNDKSEKLIG